MVGPLMSIANVSFSHPAAVLSLVWPSAFMLMLCDKEVSVKSSSLISHKIYNMQSHETYRMLVSPSCVTEIPLEKLK